MNLSPGAVALVAMAATFGAATRATFTSIVFAFELTRDYQAVLPLMLAAVLADIVFNSLSEQSLMTEKLARRGVNVPRRYAPDVRSRLEAGGHSAYPLVDEHGRCAGIVTRSDLFVDELPDDEPVTRVATTEVVTVAPDDSLLTVLERIMEEGVDHVPVVEHDRLVGICTRTDLLRARSRYLEHERRQAGWRPQFRRAQRYDERKTA